MDCCSGGDGIQWCLGFSVGATLGYAIALAGKQRVLACIGDGSFQLTAQVFGCRPTCCGTPQGACAARDRCKKMALTILCLGYVRMWRP